MKLFNPYKPKNNVPINKQCSECRGSGHVPKMTFPFMWLPKVCPKCNGSGTVKYVGK